MKCKLLESVYSQDDAEANNFLQVRGVDGPM